MIATTATLTTAALRMRERAIAAQERAEYEDCEGRELAARTYRMQAASLWRLAEATAAQARDGEDGQL